jgi:LysM repeat protein
MRRGRSPILFIILNVIISAAVALGLVNYLGGTGSTGGESQIVPVTVQILVTPTPDPDGDATRIASAVEATLEVLGASATEEVDLPPEILTDLPSAPNGNNSDPGSGGGSDSGDSVTVSGTPLPDGCVSHILEEGDFPSTLAEEYGVSMFSILLANELDDESARFLQIGDELIIPLANCPLEELIPPTPEVSETPTPTDVPEEETIEADSTDEVEAVAQADDDSTEEPDVTPTPSATPTATPAVAPTATNAQVRIVEILSPGDITAEGIRIVNEGNAVNVAGWTLTDAQGNQFVLPEQRLFTNGSVTIYSRPGEDTPIVFFWGRSTAVWGDDGDVATLENANGQVQSSVLVTDLAP